MKTTKKNSLVVVLVVIVLLAAVIAAMFYFRRSSARGELAGRIVEMGPAGAPPETIEGLKSAIAVYEARLEAHVKDAAQAGIYWKILAVRLIDRQMYGEALEALNRAVAYFPDDATLFYLRGLSAASVAKSLNEAAGPDQKKERSRLLAMAEKDHLRSIALQDRYARPRYALGVLYIFELDKSAAAIPQLERYLELESRDVDAMFLLARAYYEQGKNEPALDWYERIIGLTKDEVRLTEAEKNKKMLLDLLYE